MKTPTKERELSQEENLIISFINSDSKLHIKTFALVYNHYMINYLMFKSNHLIVLKAIYLENHNVPKWALANYCNMSKTTFYDYRHDIIDCFYTCLKENIALEELSLTKG